MPSIDLKNYVMAVQFPEQPDINQGTAFLISRKDSGYAVTCYHVVGDHDPVVLYFQSTEEPIPAKIHGLDKKMDIAILKLLEPPPEALQILKLEAEEYTGREFMSFGFSQGSKGLRVEGKIIGLVPPYDKLPQTLPKGLYQLGTKHVENGVSGAPVVLKNSEIVIGMIVAFNNTLRNVNDDLAFAQTSDAILGMCGDLIPQGQLKNREEWVAHLGFKVDPFLYVDGGEDPNILNYFSPVPDLHEILENASRFSPVFVFGTKGSGKSSLRNAIAHMSRNDGILPIVYSDLGSLVDKAQNDPPIKPLDHVQQLIRLILRELADRMGTNTENKLTADLSKERHRDYLWAFVVEFENDPTQKEKLRTLLSIKAESKPEALPVDHRDLLGNFCRCITELFELRGIYFLVDPAYDISPSADVAWQVLEPLLSQSRLINLQEYRGAFMFFLNEKFLAPALKIQWIESKRDSIFHPLVWSRDDLGKLLTDRLRLSSEKTPPHLGLDGLSDVGDLDDQVIRRSYGKPRQLISICNRLFRQHCRAPVAKDNRLITLEEVGEVFGQIDAELPESMAEQILRGDKELDPYTINDLIAQGENDLVEFKSSLRYNIEAKQSDKVMEQANAKTIGGFMNTEGGILLIGVNDKGDVLGIDSDLMILNKKDDDGFLLALTEILEVKLDHAYRQHIKFSIESYQGKKICLVRVTKSQEPVFCLLDQGWELYVRVGNSTRRLDAKDTLKYVRNHFTSYWENL